jgi:hypothetical protein
MKSLTMMLQTSTLAPLSTLHALAYLALLVPTG